MRPNKYVLVNYWSISWLFKLFSPDRLPRYEQVFSKALSEQTDRFADVPTAETLPATDGQSFMEPKSNVTPHEKLMIHDLTLITRATEPPIPVCVKLNVCLRRTTFCIIFQINAKHFQLVVCNKWQSILQKPLTAST